jgi:hypothetical protein
MGCDQNIRTAHSKVIDDAIASINSDIQNWASNQTTLIKDSLITRIVSDDCSLTLDLDYTDPRLTEWVTRVGKSLRNNARTLLVEDMVKEVIEPWAIEALTDAKCKASICNTNEYADFNHQQRIAKEAKAIADAKVFYDNTLTNLLQEAQVRAETEANAHYESTLHSQRA